MIKCENCHRELVFEEGTIMIVCPCGHTTENNVLKGPEKT